MPPGVWQNYRVVGVEDGGFSRESVETALLVAVLLDGRSIIGLQLDNIEVDGLDATEKLIAMLKQWSFDGVILAGVSFAGFNMIDAEIISEEFEKPVIIVARKKPNNLAVKNALIRHFEDWKIRWEVIEKLGSIFEIVSVPNEPPIYTEMMGTNLGWTSNLVRNLSAVCRIPEPIRVARLIARGVTLRG